MNKPFGAKLEKVIATFLCKNCRYIFEFTFLRSNREDRHSEGAIQEMSCPKCSTIKKVWRPW